MSVTGTTATLPGLTPGATSSFLVRTADSSTPQSLHHFTLADQMDRLVAAREADPDLGFMARLLALCSLLTCRLSSDHRLLENSASGHG